MTVVLDDEDEGHAVLTVTTGKGDYVLDNKKEDILLWSKTGYRFSGDGNRSPTPTYGRRSLIPNP